MDVATKSNLCNKFSHDHPYVYWYFSPITDQLRHSCSTCIYHLLNFTLALTIFIVDVTIISVSVSLTALFCIGIVLLWLSFEIVLMFSRIDLMMAYYLVEDDKTFKPNKPLSLQLRLLLLRLPRCSDLFSRIKFFYTAWPTYIMIIYQIIVKPIITLLTSWTVIIVFYWIFMMVLPIWYGADSTRFKDNQVCVFGGTDCHGDGDNNCKCYGWNMNNIGNCFASAIVSIVTLPLIVRINNYSAKLSKMVTYYCLTPVYQDGANYKFEDRSKLISNANANVNENEHPTDTDIVVSKYDDL